MSLSLVSGKSAFLHDGYIATIENCCASIAVKCTLFPTHVVSLLLSASFNTIFATLVGKTGRGGGVGVGDKWVKSGDWELGDYVTELCFDYKLD